jgi:hypothetical protein
MSGRATPPAASWAGFGQTLLRLLGLGVARLAMRVRAALTRDRWALVSTLIAGTAVWVVMPAVVRRTIGGDCRVYVVPVDASVDGRTLGIDPASCPLSQHEVLAVWAVALVVAVLSGFVTLRIVARRR